MSRYPKYSESNEVEEAIKRILSHKGVVGLVVINHEGIPIKSTMENALSVQYAAQVTQLLDKSRSMIKELDSNNDLTFIRLRTKKHEVLVCPEKDYAMIVIQNPTES
ncbi:Dynein light chain roadblock-type 2 [Orchesella cincta]|uniref:Dynein light chain roadblock n=1 Tax=Orchesella cincta TaxID=48709 RepID=A0A1D2N7J8_ORCCI|nr:Dynein light chain roadblock-type 2 [Orchesella cincta]